MEEINVIVISRKGRKNLSLKYTDPITGHDVWKSAGTTVRKLAVKRAGEWQREVNETGTMRAGSVRWDDFCEDFIESEIQPLSKNYCVAIESTFSIVEQLMNPDKISRISAAWLKQFRTKARKRGVADATVHKYMQHLKTALKWAVDQGYLKQVPAFPGQKKNAAKSKKLMKGRPISTEEFERMESACESPSLMHLLRGLWLSGLRLGEAMSLTWDQWADGIRIEVDSDGDVFLLIDGTDQKNGQCQRYPVVDDFARFLLKTPVSQRQGFVFNPVGNSGGGSRRVDTVSDWIVAIGQKAGVKVDMKQPSPRRKKPTDELVPVYASAHDLRRSFGDRWARIVEPMVLRDLMRHASVVTTEQFYIGINAKKTLKHLREAKLRSGVPLGVPLG